MDLDDLLKTRKPRLRDTVHLLLLKTTEIDTAGEHMANAAGPGSLRFAPDDLGIHGELQDVMLPDSLGAFPTGETFMHSGLSLPECVIPVLSAELGQPTTSSRASTQLQLQYRGGKTRHITTKNPIIEVILFQQEMFATALSFRLEVRAGKKLVGQVAAAPQVDSTTGLVSLEPGAAVKIPLRMAEDFEGSHRPRHRPPHRRQPRHPGPANRLPVAGVACCGPMG